MAAVNFGLAGTLAANVNSATLAITAPACSVGDLMVAAIMSNDNLAWTLPTGWTTLGSQQNNTAAQTAIVAYKIAAIGDPSAAFNFVKASNNSLLSAGVIYSFTNPNPISPIDASGIVYNATAVAADNFSFSNYEVHVQNRSRGVLIGFYNLNGCASTPISYSGWAAGGPFIQNEQSSALGNTCDIVVTQGGLDVSGFIGAGTLASNSTVDAINIGATFFLNSYIDGGSSGASGSQSSYGNKIMPIRQRVRSRC